MKLKKLKICISLFWLLLFSVLLYGMIFISTRSFKEVSDGLEILLLILFMGFLSIFLEKLLNNITITYFLIWYFGIPILFTIRINYSLFIQEITINNLIDMGFYIGFFLFTFLSILGFISWIKEKYITLKICLVVCIFFYFPFLLFALIVLFGTDH